MVSALKFKRRSRIKRSIPERFLFSFVFGIFSAFALFYIYIVFFMVMSGLKTHDEIAISPTALPAQLQWGNYKEIFSKLKVAGFGFYGMLFNSLYFATLGPLLTQLCTCLFAYTCTKYEFPGSKLVYPTILIMMTLPLYGQGGAQYLIIKRLGLIDSYLHIVLALTGVNGTFLYYNAIYRNVSDSFGEAAIMDGANDFQIYWKIMLPQASGLFLAMFITGWVGEWNNYTGILIYLPHIPTLAGGLFFYKTEAVYDARYDLLYAAYTVCSIPSLILFICFNNTLLTSVSFGGVKE